MVALLRRWLVFGIAFLVWASATPASNACPFCGMQGQTLTNEIDQASMVLYGTLRDAKPSSAGTGFSEGTTDLAIEAVIKKHEILGGKKVITLNRYVPTDNDNKYKFLVFCDVFKGKVDPYRGMPVKTNSDIVKYLDGAVKVKGKEIGVRLKYFFDYLDNGDVEISTDAYKEFANADYKDYRDMAHALPADKIAAWLKDPNTPNFRYGLYASMLGHCGKKEHADLLRGMLDDSQKRLSSGVDGILAGYILLEPKEGWAYLQGIVNDSARDFTLRYAALRTVRFLWDSRPDIVDKKQLLQGVTALVEQPDIADLAIEDLRKWSQWQAADKVLGLVGRSSHNIPIVRRAILRYALSCPENAEATKLVADMRQKDARMVKDAEELLKLESMPPSAKMK